MQKQPPSSDTTHEESAPEPQQEEKKSSHPDAFDFGLAFVDTAELEERPSRSGRPQTDPKSSMNKTGVVSLRYPDFPVPAVKARVAVLRNNLKTSLYSVGKVVLRGAGQKNRISFRGRLLVEASYSAGKVLVTADDIKRREVSVPCTLLSENEYNFIELDDGSYRGSMIIISEKPKRFSLVNYIDVEEYLRGVVPLEIGPRKEKEIEAVKAQAVAARTYTYRKILERSNASFDLVTTVADQVYGGLNAENRHCDKAIRLTEDLVMVYGDSLIIAYYHSTCGGKTANVEDVWQRPPKPYLKSVSDYDKNGNAYCAISRYYTWIENWSTYRLSSIIARHGGSAGCKGTVKGMKIKWRHSCGRIADLNIRTTQGDCVHHGDKIRFVLRRDISGNPILRSCNFRIRSGNARSVKIEGKGYGHGVGMCQMGAIGRARAGQSFEEILKAYYTGVDMRTAVPKR
ncbi:MAG: SpoIID/LytB domain-containing protein [Chitinivibrionales bacterium]|nr:SpoIID/LytB domain-containing protein [Chitinivibrionales bacterium]